LERITADTAAITAKHCRIAGKISVPFVIIGVYLCLTISVY